MAQVSDTKDIGGDTWKEAGVGEFARIGDGVRERNLFFSRKIPRWILGGMPVHLHICRPRSLVDREIRSTYTCIIDSLPVLGWCKSITLAGLFWSKFRERSAKDRRKARELVARFRTSPASASGKGA